MSINHSPNASWQAPTRMDALSFWWRSTLLVAWHGLRNTVAPRARRWRVDSALADATIIAQQRSPLWVDGRPDEFPLIAGKVHNLRIARKAFHAIEIPAGEVFSFWTQLGRPSARRGFVEGREVREGCVVPTLAGGICQLSNALATAALHARMELVERHAHSARIEAAKNPGEIQTIDATVFWNYIDLKLRAPFAWRLEVEMTTDELIVTIRANPKATRKTIPLTAPQQRVEATTPTVRGCLTCNQTQCFRHRTPQKQVSQGRAALLLDAWSPEFSDYLHTYWHDADYFVPVPFRVAFWRARNNAWQMQQPAYRAGLASVWRALWLRAWARHVGGRRQASILDGNRWLAQAYAKQLRPEHTTLIIDQALLPHLASSGAFAGRRIIVLAHALPMQAIEERLDAAAKQWPQDASLRDYRVATTVAQAERQGLMQAERIVTSHADVAAQLPAVTRATIEVLPWMMPAAGTNTTRHARDTAMPPLVVFPSTAIARKGVHELAHAIRGLHCRLRILGTPLTDCNLFTGISVEYVDHAVGVVQAWLTDADAVVLPAHVEHQPRQLLAALASGIPVITTSACGIIAREGLHLVPAGDIDSLRAALQAVLDGRA